MSSQNVLILSSDTGGGHNSAASALENSLIRRDSDQIMVKIAKVLEDSSAISRRFADIYNYLLREHQDWMKYYYWFIEKLKPNESKLILDAALGYGSKLVDRFTPSAVVSVHPMTQHFMAYVMEKVGLLGKIPFHTVVTDPCAGFWRGWACEHVDRYYVASSEAKQQLIDYGVGSHKIKIAGVPVHSRFTPVDEIERHMLRVQYGLDPNRFTVFLNSGWIGGGNIPKIFQELAQSELPIQAIFLAGQNDTLAKTAHEIAQSAPFPVKVMGYTEQIQDLMNLSDVMVTKMGGLTTFEALACQLPIIADVVTQPMPQEEQTAEFLTKTNTGLLLERPTRIVSVVESLLNDPNRLEAMRQSALHYSMAGASDRIAHDVVQATERKRA